MSVANSYAKALYEAAVEAKTPADGLDQLETQLGAIVSALETSSDVRGALLGPVTSAKDKGALISEFAAKAGLSRQLVQFLTLLANKGRLSLLAEIRDAFRSARLEAEGGVAGDLVSAEPIGDADMKALTEAFGRKLGKRIAFRVSTDPSLLAGMKVTVNGVTYDGSLRSQLQRLRDRVALGIPQG